MMAGLLPCFILLVLAFCHTWIAEGMKDESFQWVRSGESVTIHCSSAEPGFDGLYLLLGLRDEKEVFFFHKENKKLNMGREYKNRVKIQGELDKLTITIGNMTDDDSGVYWCKYRYFNPDEGQALKKTGIGSTLVVVNGKPCPPVEGTVLTKNLVIVTAISAVSVLLLCITVLHIWVKPRIKKLSAKKKHGHARRTDSVYEDMRKTNFSQRHQPLQQNHQFH